ncbi:hypothetical protein RUM44_004611 [Polyplax serrata]|uniref:BAH domain-containing protein n=1 Tax=Polyplax serrata TaxID=468196 RepID=A0ABR1B3D1_POLSC
MGYPRGYPPYQGGYYQGSYYPPPPQSAHYQPPPPSFHQHYHHHQDLCYPPGYPPSSYPPPPGSYRRFLQPPPGYYSPELTYGSSGPPPPPPSQDHGAQQMVVPGGSSSSYSASLDPYPPPAPYYPGYSPGPGPACYSHPPSSRNLAFIEQTYQSCPCPMQLCPKNVHIGPLTGECKRPGALPLPPVALQLPQEPPGAAGPPSPARGSAGMPPQPSPVSHSTRHDWDGRTTKSSSEVKWEESKTNLEIKPLKYKRELVNGVENKDVEDLSSPKNLVTGLEKSANALDSQWNEMSYGKKEKEPENYSQGLLAISSKEMLLLAARTQSDLTETVAERLEENMKIKLEASSPTLEKNDQIIMKKVQQNSRKRNFVGQDSNESPKRKKLVAKLEEILVNNLEESKRRKKKVDDGQENSENKVRKSQKPSMMTQKDENACCDRKLLSKHDKNSNSKAKLLKDRNETVEWKRGVENALKGPGKKEKKVEDGATNTVNSERIVNRRKSNQDRSGIFLEGKIQLVRKSKSCSPSRSKTREHSPIRLPKDETKRKQDGTKNGKAKGEAKVKGNLQEHSRTGTGKRKNCSGNGSKGGKQVGFLNKSANSKSKKTKSTDYSLSALKKLNSKKGAACSPRSGVTPKWSNGWSWDSESFDAKVYLANDEPPVMRKCYTAMRHVEGDVIHPKDCILLKAGPRKIDLPFVAKVAALWENPDDGEMMVSLLWYYRPEHTDQGRQPSDQQDEIFASRHKDINSVACIEDKCFVLTYNEYCRYRKKVKRVEEGVAEKNLPIPRLEQPYFRFQRQPPCVMAPDMVFFCRRVYDFRQKRLLKNPS